LVFNVTVFQDDLEQNLHFALSLGEINSLTPTLVRVHNLDLLQDILGVDVAMRWSLNAALEKVAKEQSGVVLLLSGKQNNQEALAKITNNQLEKPSSYSIVGIGSQILHDLGVRKMRLLNSPAKFNALSGFDLEVVEYLSPN